MNTILIYKLGKLDLISLTFPIFFSIINIREAIILNAYSTVITKDLYLPFVIRQKQMMDKLQCKYPFVVMVSDTVSEWAKEELKKYNILYEEVPTFKFNCRYTKKYEDTLNKFQFLKLEQYEKVIFLDADIIIYKNLDDIFDIFDYTEKNLYLISCSNVLDKNREEAGNNYIGWVMICHPSLDYFNKINELAKKVYSDSDESFTSENQFFYNCDCSELNTDPLHEVLHFAGINKLEHPLLQILFDYNNFDFELFYDFILKNINDVKKSLDNKINFNDYCLLMENYHYRNNSCIYVISLLRENEFNLIKRLNQRLLYLNSKYDLLVLLSKNLEHLSQRLIDNNISYVLVDEEQNNYKYCYQLTNYTRFIYFNTICFPKENLDDLFAILGNYTNINNYLYVLDSKNLNDKGRNINAEFIDKILSKNLLIINTEKLFKFNNEPTILHLLSVWSANKFNNMLNEHFDELKFLISSLENYEYSMDDLYLRFNLFNIKI